MVREAVQVGQDDQLTKPGRYTQNPGSGHFECNGDVIANNASTKSMSQMETYLHGDSNGHGFAILGCGGEFPPLHCINCCFVKIRAQCRQDADIAGLAIGTYNYSQRNDAFMTCFSLFFRVRGLGSASLLGRRNAAHHIIAVAATSKAAL
jgi:hypothetical protein